MMLEAIKNKRVLMIGGAALVGILILWFGYRAMFGHSGEAETTPDGKPKGTWFTNVIPDLPPIPFDPQKDWGVATEKLAQTAAATQAKVKNGIRVERGKSPAFDDGLLIVDSIQVDNTLPNLPRIQVRLSHHGDRTVDNARLDILFLDSKATALARRAVNPLVVAGGLLGDKVKSLRPGEVREFYVDATQAPMGWIDQLTSEVVYYQFAP
ncbi:MAG: hypothetical protein HQL87_00765 [Magnetococcales bacterium]|nr:hypothetical protein [Magnetococcales bacterium]